MFKNSFKYYKSKNPPPILKDVLDLKYSRDLEEKLLIKQLKLDLKDSKVHYGLKKPEEWEVYNITSCNGLIFIKNPFIPGGQRYWIKKCLKDYTKKPNQLNIDNNNVLPNNSEWWDVAQSDKIVLQRLRWATLGYHHNWDTKIYSEDNRSEFPYDLKLMTEYIAKKLGFTDFVAEAAIVNYYHLDSMLSGHTDHSEQNLEAPLFSFSFGQSAIFLLGGKTIDEKPIAICLQSGDILIMSKDSRLCYHGVPKILRTECDIWNEEDGLDFNNEDYFVANDPFWIPFNEYLGHSRVNLNVRQVLKIGQLKLCI